MIGMCDWHSSSVQKLVGGQAGGGGGEMGARSSFDCCAFGMTPDRFSSHADMSAAALCVH